MVSIQSFGVFFLVNPYNPNRLLCDVVRAILHQFQYVQKEIYKKINQHKCLKFDSTSSFSCYVIRGFPKKAKYYHRSEYKVGKKFHSSQKNCFTKQEKKRQSKLNVVIIYSQSRISNFENRKVLKYQSCLPFANHLIKIFCCLEAKTERL